MLEESRSIRAAYAELEWIATHWDEATPEQRARFEAFSEALDQMDE